MLVAAVSLRLYNNLVEKCFKDCVLDFRSKNLAKDEEKVTSCDMAQCSAAVSTQKWQS